MFFQIIFLFNNWKSTWSTPHHNLKKTEQFQSLPLHFFSIQMKFLSYFIISHSKKYKKKGLKQKSIVSLNNYEIDNK